MGAGASVDADGVAGTEDALKLAEETSAHVGETAEAASGAVAGAAAGAADAAGSAASDVIAKAVGSVPDDAKEKVGEVFVKASAVLTPAQLSGAADELVETAGPLAAAATTTILATTGGIVSAAGDALPEVAEAVGTVLAGVAANLPYIGVAAGCLGAIVATFQASKDDDKNVKTVLIWSASVKDWLLMVTDKVCNSAAESTLPLFKELKDQLVLMCGQMEKQNKKWRIGKMLSSSSFRRDFERAKTSVLELKTALRDFLDQEQQDAQDKQLSDIASTNLALTEQLATQADQLDSIKQMLEAQAAAEAAKAAKAEADAAAAAADPTNVKADEERIYENLQRAAKCGADEVPFKDFVLTFEMFFLDGLDMHPECKRGLRYNIDKDHNGGVSQAEWLKFYRAWTKSGMAMEEYLLKCADEAPKDPMKEAWASAATAAAGAHAKAAEHLAVAGDMAAKGMADMKDMGGKMMGGMGGMFGKK